MNKNFNKKLSIVIPVFNEMESLEELNLRITKALSGLSFDYEIVYIDDGSTDNSFKILKKIKERNPKIKIIQFRRNFGKSAALNVAFKEANGDLIITMDGDLQDEPTEIINFIKKIEEGYDMVSGWKQNRKDPLIKLISSKIFNFTVSKLTKIKLHDFNCGFKIYRSEVIKNIEIYGELHRFLPVLAYEKGFKIGELKIKHNARKFGKSKYGKLGLRRIKNYLLDPINIILLTKYAKKPAHFFGNIGLLSFGLGSVFFLYLTILWLLGHRPIGNRPLLFLGILLIIIGIQLISMGFLGEIITRQNSKKEKIYYVKK
ncbi:glycosyltransferase family 2 protein [Candidatus Falkowbacteria bacterium]|jgi:glycosyltransferase involved in cell wall biosynthesis|nr:glycosyltransferase family 2 protein [Candidatus Falkowbacteria bacterium]MBT4432937.1 glycosyltransferase family 2 protein [Candidatus Falkowbacteria bacterium]